MTNRDVALVAGGYVLGALVVGVAFAVIQSRKGPCDCHEHADTASGIADTGDGVDLPDGGAWKDLAHAATANGTRSHVALDGDTPPA